MSQKRVLILTLFAMIEFAGNSLLCRVALNWTKLTPPVLLNWNHFGAFTLWIIVRMRGGPRAQRVIGILAIGTVFLIW